MKTYVSIGLEIIGLFEDTILLQHKLEIKFNIECQYQQLNPGI
jgi:hypothetical protein